MTFSKTFRAATAAAVVAALAEEADFPDGVKATAQGFAEGLNVPEGKEIEVVINGGHDNASALVSMNLSVVDAKPAE